MLLPIAWLKNYCKLEEDSRTIADEITNTGSHVESILKLGEKIDRVVLGKILSIEPHPDADRLVVCQVDIGGEEIQIVTAAPNVFEGGYLPVALHKSSLADGTVIKKSKLRGLPSEGMFCSYQELGFDGSVIPPAFKDGVLIFEEGGDLGQDIRLPLDMDEDVFELEITPNRPDCLSILGMARETAASLNKTLVKPNLTVEEDEKKIEDLAKGVYLETEDCSRYYSRVLYDVEIKASPQWMQNLLMQAGVRPINNIVDLTNFVMLELGQPLHAFDLDFLTGREIRVRNGKEGESLVTLDGEERKVGPEDVLICDGEKAIGLAGIMGGLDSEVKEETKNILLEGASFDPYKVRQTSKKFGLRTEASTRFEKGLDANMAQKAVDRVCVLAKELGIAKLAQGKFDQGKGQEEGLEIPLRPDRANLVLGTDLSVDQMLDYLNRLEIESKEEDGKILAKVPSFRQDITIEEDLIEEIGRIYGFHSIEPKPLSGLLTRGGKPLSRQLESRIKRQLLSLGYNEWMTFSFMSPKAYDRIRLEKDSPLRRSVELLDPLGEEYSVMRSTLVPNLLDVLSKNMNRKNPEAFGYEFGNTFSLEKDKDNLPTERKRLSLGFYGDQDFYFLKASIEEIFASIGLGQVSVKRANCPFLHPGRSGEVYLGEDFYGVFGEVHPKVLENYKMKQRVYVAELDFEKMIAAPKMEVKYQDQGKYPSSSRDLAFILGEREEIGGVKALVEDIAGDLLSHFEVFDIYRGQGIEPGKKSVAFSMEFKSKDHTLKEEEVAPIVEKIIQAVEEKMNGHLRD